MKQEMRRTKKASEVRPALDEMVDFNGQAGSGFIVDCCERRTWVKEASLPV